MMNSFSPNTAREQMIYHQVRPWDVNDPRVFEIMEAVPREQFVPEQFRQLAFADAEIPLPCGQSMLKPILEGRILQTLAPAENDRALVIGTGSGYLAACIARAADHVTSLDIHAELTDAAAVRMTDEKVRNIELLTADFMNYQPSGGFDCILIAGSMPQFDARLPEWLNEDGRMLLFTGSAPSMKAELVVRTGETYRRTRLFETVVPALENVPQPDSFSL